MTTVERIWNLLVQAGCAHLPTAIKLRRAMLSSSPVIENYAWRAADDALAEPDFPDALRSPLGVLLAELRPE